MEVVFLAGDIIEIDHSLLHELKQRALRAPRRRARVCLHKSHQDSIQEMLICFCIDSYIPPHRHTNKNESYHIVEGRATVYILDESGRVRRQIEMGDFSSKKTFFYRLSTDAWHTMVPRTEFVILHEVTDGPFLQQDNDLPSWAPRVDDAAGVERYLQMLAASAPSPV